MVFKLRQYKFILCVISLSFYSLKTMADTISPTSVSVNFGTWYQANGTASLTMDYTGAITRSSGMKGGPSSGTTEQLKFKAVKEGLIDLWRTITLEFPNSVSLTSAGSNCTLTATNFTANSTNFTLSIGDSKNLTFGATININSGSSLCKAGTYTGAGVVSFEASSRGTRGTATINLSVALGEQISIENRQDMDFGAMITPSGNGTVVLSTSGGRTANGVILMGTLTPKQGQFSITGTPNTVGTVNNIAATTLSNGKDTMQVDSFVKDRDTFILDATGAIIMNVGATLHIPAHVSEGNYTGTYTVTVSY